MVKTGSEEKRNKKKGKGRGGERGEGRGGQVVVTRQIIKKKKVICLENSRRGLGVLVAQI
jgi:hypothetical protein